MRELRARFHPGGRGARLGAVLTTLLILLFAGPLHWPGAPSPAFANITSMSITASATELKAGESAQFSATVECAGSGGLLDLTGPPPEGHIAFKNASTGQSFDYVPTDTNGAQGTATSTWVEFAPNQQGGSDYSITATYVPGEGGPCDASTASVTVHVSPAVTTVQLFSYSDFGTTPYIGNRWHFGAQVASDTGLVPTGRAYLVDDTGSGSPTPITDYVDLDGGGFADFRLDLDVAGAHNIFAVFDPVTDFRFTSVESGREAITLQKYPTDVAIPSPPTEPVSTDDTVAFNVTLLSPSGFSGLTEHRTGTVDLKVDGVTVKTETVSGAWVSGSVAVLVTDLPTGTHEVTADYSGDDHYAAASTTTAVTVEVYEKWATDVTFLTFPSSPMLATPDTTITVALESPPGGPGRSGLLTLLYDAQVVGMRELDPATDGVYVTFTVTLHDLEVGTHTLQAGYTGDAEYSAGSVSRDLTVREPATGLAITSRDDIEHTSPGAAGLTINYDVPTASDSDGPVAVDCDPASGSLFSVGVTTVTCTATDLFATPDPVVTTSFTVTVNYGELTIDPLHTVTVTATSAAGATITYETPQASSTVNAEVAVTCDWPSGSLFPVGVTFVHCTATDTSVYPSSLRTTASFVVNADETAPVLSDVPEDITTTATALDGATVTFTLPTAIDAVNGAVAVSCTPASGATFAIGDTTVTCTASDGSGNEVSDTFTVTVLADEAAPVLSDIPEDITTTATDTEGIAVTYTPPTATDAVNGAVAVSCDPASGATFPIGDTTVTCTASDGSGNEVSDTFTVTVLPQAPAVADISAGAGPAGGGQRVTLTGTWLSGATVRFGSSAATVLSNTDTSVEVRTPAGAGAVDVTVTTAGGTSAPVTYTYEEEPAPPPRRSSREEPGGVTVEVEAPQTALVDETDEVVLETRRTDGSSAKVVAPTGALPAGAEVSVGAIADVEDLVRQAPPPRSADVVLAFQVNATSAGGDSIHRFDRPVELTFTVPADQVPRGTGRRLTVVFWNGSEWEDVPARLERNADGSVTLVATVRHFTLFAVASREGYQTFLTPLTPGGVTLTMWGGGAIEDAASVEGVASLWLWVDGRPLGYIVGAPDFADAAFREHFDTGSIPPDTPLLVVSASE